MGKNISLLVNSGGASSQAVALDSNKPVKIKIQDGNQYILKNQDNNYAPENLTLKRQGNDLYVILEGETDPCLVIDDYYVSGNHQPLLGIAEDGQLYSYVTTDVLSNGYMLADDGLTSVALGGSSLGDSSYLFQSEAYSDGLMSSWPWFLGAAALGGFGYAIYDMNNDDDSTYSPPSSSPPDSQSIPQFAPQPEIQPESLAEPLPTPGGGIDVNYEISVPAVSGTSTTENRTTIYGVGEAGDTVTIYDNGQAIGTALVNADGQWQFVSEIALNQGGHSITLTQTGPSGSTSGSSDAFSFTVDTIAPTQPVASSLMVDSQSGAILSGTKIASALPTFSGEGEPGSVITFMDDTSVSKQMVMSSSGKRLLMADNPTTLSDNSHVIGQVVVGADGKWSFTPAQPLAEGPHHITMIATDSAGNRSTVSELMKFEVDTIAPEIPVIDAIQDSFGDANSPILRGGYTNDAKPTIKGHSEPGSTITVTDHSEVIAQVITNASGNWTYTPEVALSEGEHCICVVASDEAGNGSAMSDSFIFKVDTLAPEQPIINGLTDHTNPPLVGEGEPNSTVTIFDNGVIIGQVPVSGEGQWVFTPDKPLSDGEHSLTVRVTDPAGNVSEISNALVFTIDNASSPTDPEIPVPEEHIVPTIDSVSADSRGELNSGMAINNGMPVLNGVAEPGSIVAVFDNGTLLGSTMTDNAGQWSFTPAAELSPGEHILTVAFTDTAGNTGEQSAGFTVVVDPEFHIDPPVPEELMTPTIESVLDDVGLIQGILNQQGVTDDARPTLTGKATVDSIVKVYDGDMLLGSAMADSNGNWSFTPDENLAEGVHSITATVTDLNDRVSEPSSAFEFTIDTIAPAAPIIEFVLDDAGAVQNTLFTNSVTADATPTLTGKAEAGCVVNVFGEAMSQGGTVLLGAVLTDNNGLWRFTLASALPDDRYKFTVTAMDDAGNVSIPGEEFNLTINTSPVTPVTINKLVDHVGKIIGEIVPNGITDDVRPDIVGLARAGSIVNVYDGAVLLGSTIADSDGNWCFTPLTDLADGAHSLTVTATDSRGFISESTSAFEVTIDTVAPVVPTIESVVDDVGVITGALQKGDVTNDDRPTLNGTAGKNCIIEVYDDTTLLGSVMSDAQGEWSFTPSAGLANGPHNLTVTATNGIGLTSQPTSIFILEVDITAPTAATNIALIDDDTTTLTGNAEANGIVTLYSNDIAMGSTKVGADGRWTFTLDAGSYAITATVMDKAGNVSQPSAAFVLTVDDNQPSHQPLILSVEDRVGEITGNIKPGDSTDDRRPIISGTGTAGDVITVYNDSYVGNVEIGRATVDTNGTWSLEPTGLLQSGNNKLTAIATDALGNVSEPSESYTIYCICGMGVSAPVIIAIMDEVGMVTGPLQKGEVTDDSRPTLYGTAEKYCVIKVYDGATLLGSAMSDSRGEWSFTPGTALADGTHNLTATASDNYGDTSKPTGIFNIIVDTIAPTAVTNIALIDDDTTTLTGNAEANGIVTLYSNDIAMGSTKVGADGRWTFTLGSTLDAGSYAITATVMDKAGNVSVSSEPFVLNVDSPVPVLVNLVITDDAGAMTGPLTNGDITDDNTPTFSGQAEANSIVTLYNGSDVIARTSVDADGNWTFTPATALPEGEYKFSIIITDKSGKISGISETVTLSLGDDPVAISITKLIDNSGDITGDIAWDGITDDTRPEITGFASKSGIVKVYDGSALLGSTIVGSDGSWSFTPASKLGQGEHSITAMVIDSRGNASAPTSAFKFTVDTIAPALPTIEFVNDDQGSIQGPLINGSATDDDTPILNGKAETNSIVKVYDGSVILGSTQADASGHWSFTPSFTLTEGSHSFVATATDKAGNTSDFSEIFNLYLETQPEWTRQPMIMGVAENTGEYILSGGVIHTACPMISGVGNVGDTVIIYTQDSTGKHEVGRTIVRRGSEWWMDTDVPLLVGENILTVVAIGPTGLASEPSEPYILIMSDVSYTVAVIEQVVDDVGAISGAVMRDEVTNDNQPTISGVAPANVIVNVYNNDVKIGSTPSDTKGNWSFTPETALADGVCHISVNTTDTLGHSTEKTGFFSFEINTVLPTQPRILGLIDDVDTITGKLPLPGDTEIVMTNDTCPQIFGVGRPGSIIEIHSFGYMLGTTVVLPDGSWSFTPDGDLESDKYTIIVCQMNQYGSVEFESPAFEFIVDSVAPVTPTIDIVDNYRNGILESGAYTNWSSLSLSGIAESDSVVRIYDGSELIGMERANTDCQWYFSTFIQTNGEHVYQITATDRAGNVSEPSATFTLHYGPYSSLLSTSLVISHESSGMDEGILQASAKALDSGDDHSTMAVALEDVLRSGLEELTLTSGNASSAVDGNNGNALRLEETDTQLSVSQSNTNNLWATVAVNVDMPTENTVHVMM